MNENITFNDLEKYKKKYDETRNIELENLFNSTKINTACENQDIINENVFKFNIELEECCIYNQSSSLRCWMFACLNLIKNNIAHNLNINPVDFKLSPAFLTFYDKLERANHTYQIIIDSKENFKNTSYCDYNHNLSLSSFLKEPLLETGSVEYARELIKKYGLVPYDVYPDNINTLESFYFIRIYQQKIRHDIYKLIECKNNNVNIEELYKLKDTFMEENYSIISKIIGRVPDCFNFSFTTINGEEISLQNITPLEFYNKFCSINLDDFILIGNVPMSNKPMYKKLKKEYSGNVHNKSFVEFINVSIDDLSNMTISQLKDGMPVCIACENYAYRNTESTVLDTRLFNYEKMLGIKDLTKQQAMDSFNITLKHWMTIKGVQIENNKPIRWKVEDNGGKEIRINGYYVMNNNFFEKCVYWVWINKKYIPKQILDINNTNPILYDYTDSISSIS